MKTQRKFDWERGEARERCLKLKTAFEIGDEVSISIGVFRCSSAIVEKVELDHSHPSGHLDACFTPDRVEYSVVVGARPNGLADYRGRWHATYMTLVKKGGRA